MAGGTGPGSALNSMRVGLNLRVSLSLGSLPHRVEQKPGPGRKCPLPSAQALPSRTGRQGPSTSRHQRD